MNPSPRVETPKTKRILELHDADPTAPPSLLARQMGTGVTKNSITAVLWRYRPGRPRARARTCCTGPWEVGEPVWIYDAEKIDRAMTGRRFQDYRVGESIGRLPPKPDYPVTTTGCSAYMASQSELAGVCISMKGRRA